jgi:hypothetical protein
MSSEHFLYLLLTGMLGMRLVALRCRFWSEYQVTRVRGEALGRGFVTLGFCGHVREGRQLDKESADCSQITEWQREAGLNVRTRGVL